VPSFQKEGNGGIIAKERGGERSIVRWGESARRYGARAQGGMGASARQNAALKGHIFEEKEKL
jgi:hypothetical protein